MANSDQDKNLANRTLILPGTQDGKVREAIGDAFRTRSQGGVLIAQTVLLLPEGFSAHGKLEIVSEVPQRLAVTFAAAQAKGASVAREAPPAANDTPPSSPQEHKTTPSGIILPGSGNALRRRRP